jgi:hypothetical protein
MPDKQTFSNLDEALDYLEDNALRTTEGSYVKMSRVKEVVRSAQEKKRKEEEKLPIPYRMSPTRARRLASIDLKEKFPEAKLREGGRSVTAGPSSSSRT